MVYDLPEAEEAEIDVVRPSAELLIIEDDESQREALQLRLSRLGYQVATTGSGLTGLQLARAHQPAAILLDVGLPDADGFDICQQLVDDAATCEIPIIIVSATDRENMVRQARRSGCQFFVRKPYDPNALLSLIEAAIREANDAG